jgi:phosphoglucomutase/phosphomannomutase
MQALVALESAQRQNRLSPGAVANIRKWLTEPPYQRYVPQVLEHVAQGKWKELDDAFWTVIPFGTGGRRGRMYAIGTNAINDRTIGESAAGLAQYVKRHAAAGQPLACGIAYDTRHNSRHFAELCASIMVAAGFTVYFLDGYRSTPELSFLVRYKKCACGIMVTASHNPPSDNAVKAYWSTGGQLVPPHDAGVIHQVNEVQEIEQAEFGDALARGRVVMCTDEVDRAYLDQVAAQALPGPRDLAVLYSPLHGVGEATVRPALQRDGFARLEVFEPHRKPDGDFPNVPGHVSNPENPAVFDAMIERAGASGAELALATDPDCDRVGCAAPVTTDPKGAWATFTGNQIGALLTDFVLAARREAGTLSPQHYLVKTLVTSELIRRIGDSYGVTTHGNLHVGFKWIGELIDQAGPDWFVLGCEESHGYLVGQYARDKDGAVACMLMAEAAARAKADGVSLHQKLDSLYRQHGYHAERQVNLTMPGSQGMARMKALMERFRTRPPQSLAGLPVAAVRDYRELTVTTADGKTQPIQAGRADMVVLDLDQSGNMVAIRPSGTEPKVKFYMFACVAPEQIDDLARTKEETDNRMAAIEAELRGTGG